MDYSDTPQKIKKAVIREDLVALTGNHISALILNQFLYWTDRVNDFDLFVKEELERDPESKIQLFSGWIYKKAEELSNELMIGATVPTIRKYIKQLVEKGYLHERNNPGDRWNKVLEYRVDIIKIQSDLFELGYPLEGYRLTKTLFNRIKNILLRDKNILLRDKENLLRSENILIEYNDTEITTEITTEKETSPTAAQNGKPATQPTDENISLSPENFLRGFVEHWIASNGTHSNPLTDKEFIELAKALHPKRPDGTNVKNRIELEKITKQIPPADRIWLLIRIIKYSQDDIILDDSGKPTFAKFLDKYIEDFHPLIDQEKEHYRERLHETQREIERETAQREAREAEEREHREQVRIVAEFENRLESMTDDEWRTIAEKTLAYIRENDGIVAYNRAKSKIDVFDNFYTKWQGAKLFFEIDA